MNEAMWHDSIVQEKASRLGRHSCMSVDPEYGEMACGGEGWGRLALLDRIVSAVSAVAAEIDPASAQSSGGSTVATGDRDQNG